jgi:hypothetical protein
MNLRFLDDLLARTLNCAVDDLSQKCDELDQANFGALRNTIPVTIADGWGSTYDIYQFPMPPQPSAECEDIQLIPYDRL